MGSGLEHLLLAQHPPVLVDEQPHGVLDGFERLLDPARLLRVPVSHDQHRRAVRHRLLGRAAGDDHEVHAAAAGWHLGLR